MMSDNYFRNICAIFILNYCVINNVLAYDHSYIDEALSVIHPVSTDLEQKQAVDRIVKRVALDRANDFVIEIDSFLSSSGKDEFKVVKRTDGKIQITGSTGVAAAYGFNHYLKYYCKSHHSWEVIDIRIPEELPAVNIHIKSMDKIRYYMNVVAYGYSHVWWNWNDWDKHVDWMALNGFNLVLAPMAQEAIWYRVYARLNLTDQEIDKYFSGPAFLPWNRMGNLHGFAGPLSMQWHERTLFLQKKLLKRYKEIGITPVLSAFNGYVPEAMYIKFPKIKKFNANEGFGFEHWGYSMSYYVEANNPLFIKLGNAYIREQIKEFGTGHVYTSDPYNELYPPTKSLTDLRDLSRAIYNAISTVDHVAVWMIQSWAFTFYREYWKEERIKAYLRGPPLGKVLVLDLAAERIPKYRDSRSFYGQPFLWCLLYNYGGPNTMFGDLKGLNELVHESREYENSTMVGTGVVPEGINNNYMVYDFMSENSWRNTKVDLKQWLKEYVIRRYGKPDEHAFKAWRILNETVYHNFTSTNRVYSITNVPSLHVRMKIFFNGTRFVEAWDQMVLAIDNLGDSEGFRYDLVDVTKQFFINQFDAYFLELHYEFMRRTNINRLLKIADYLYEILLDMDRLLLTNKFFLLGPYIESARAAAKSNSDRRLFEYNAKNLITLWGPRGELKDYATRYWAGLFSDYYTPRWKILLDEIKHSVTHKINMETKENRKYITRRFYKEVEKPFLRSTKNYTTEPIGDTLVVVYEIYKKWRPRFIAPRLQKNDITSWINYAIQCKVNQKCELEKYDKKVEN